MPSVSSVFIRAADSRTSRGRKSGRSGNLALGSPGTGDPGSPLDTKVRLPDDIPPIGDQPERNTTMTAATDMADRIARAFKGDGASEFAACFAEEGTQLHSMLGMQEGRAAIEAGESTMFSAFDDIDFT